MYMYDIQSEIFQEMSTYIFIAQLCKKQKGAAVQSITQASKAHLDLPHRETQACMYVLCMHVYSNIWPTRNSCRGIIYSRWSISQETGTHSQVRNNSPLVQGAAVQSMTPGLKHTALQPVNIIYYTQTLSFKSTLIEQSLVVCRKAFTCRPGWGNLITLDKCV